MNPQWNIWTQQIMCHRLYTHRMNISAPLEGIILIKFTISYSLNIPTFPVEAVPWHIEVETLKRCRDNMGDLLCRKSDLILGRLGLDCLTGVILLCYKF